VVVVGASPKRAAQPAGPARRRPLNCRGSRPAWTAGCLLGGGARAQNAPTDTKRPRPPPSLPRPHLDGLLALIADGSACALGGVRDGGAQLADGAADLGAVPGARRRRGGEQERGGRSEQRERPRAAGHGGGAHGGLGGGRELGLGVGVGWSQGRLGGARLAGARQAARRRADGDRPLWRVRASLGGSPCRSHPPAQAGSGRLGSTVRVGIRQPSPARPQAFPPPPSKQDDASLPLSPMRGPKKSAGPGWQGVGRPAGCCCRSRVGTI
jgi:hypothetical protein